MDCRTYSVWQSFFRNVGNYLEMRRGMVIFVALVAKKM